MTFSPLWFSHSAWFIGTWGIWLVILAACTRPAWRSLQQHQRLPAAIGIFALLWLLNVRVEAGQLAGMSYHLLGINLITLMLGAPTTLWLISAGLLLFGIAHHNTTFISVFAMNALCVILPACTLNVVVRRFILCRLPRNVFIYIFCGGFLSGAIGMLLTGIVVCATLQAAQILPTTVIWTQAFPIFFLLSWGEAFLSGIGTAVCVAFKPEQLTTFDDALYLHQPRKQIWTDE